MPIRCGNPALATEVGNSASAPNEIPRLRPGDFFVIRGKEFRRLRGTYAFQHEFDEERDEDEQSSSTKRQQFERMKGEETERDEREQDSLPYRSGKNARMDFSAVVDLFERVENDGRKRRRGEKSGDAHGGEGDGEIRLGIEIE